MKYELQHYPKNYTNFMDFTISQYKRPSDTQESFVSENLGQDDKTHNTYYLCYISQSELNYATSDWVLQVRP